MDDVLAILVLAAVLVNLIASLVVATTPMGRVRRAAARGRPGAQREYGEFLGWLLLLLFGGPAVVFALLALLISWPEPWRVLDGLFWVVLLGTFVTCPGILALTARIVVEGARNDGSPMGVRCPVSCRRLRIP